MKLIRIGKRVINLEYLVLAEEWDGMPETGRLSPGGLRVTLESGRVLTLNNGEAQTFLRFLEDELFPRLGGQGIISGMPYDPKTGEALPPGGTGEPKGPG